MDRSDKTEADRRRLVANERVKATVNLINSVANTMIATGVIGPLVADIYGLAVSKSPYWWQFSALWLFGCRATIKVRTPDNQDEKVVARLVS